MSTSSLRDLFSDIANAIRAKTHDESALTPAEFADEIGTITAGADLSVVTAAAADVKSGKKFVDSTGATVNGSMPVRQPEAIFLSANASYTIPAGYHSGSGVVMQTLPEQPATNHVATKNQQTIIPAGTYCAGAQILKPITATNLTAANIKSGVNVKINNGNEDVLDVTGTYNASPDYIFKEVTFTSSDPECEQHLFGVYSGPTSVVGFSIPAYKVILENDARLLLWKAQSLLGTANSALAMGFITDFSYQSSAAQTGYANGGGELQTASFCKRDEQSIPDKKVVYIPAETVSAGVYKATFALMW